MIELVAWTIVFELGALCFLGIVALAKYDQRNKEPLLTKEQYCKILEQIKNGDFDEEDE